MSPPKTKPEPTQLPHHQDNSETSSATAGCDGRSTLLSFLFLSHIIKVSDTPTPFYSSQPTELLNRGGNSGSLYLLSHSPSAANPSAPESQSQRPYDSPDQAPPGGVQSHSPGAKTSLFALDPEFRVSGRWSVRLRLLLGRSLYRGRRSSPAWR